MHGVVQLQRELARLLDPDRGDIDAESAGVCERKVQRMTLIGWKKLYRRGLILAHLSGKDFAARPGQGNAKDSIRMRVLGNLGFRGINSINQSQAGELA